MPNASVRARNEWNKRRGSHPKRKGADDHADRYRPALQATAVDTAPQLTVMAT